MNDEQSSSHQLSAQQADWLAGWLRHIHTQRKQRNNTHLYSQKRNTYSHSSIDKLWGSESWMCCGCVCVCVVRTLLCQSCVSLWEKYTIFIFIFSPNRKKKYGTHMNIYSYRTMRAKKEYRRRKWHVTHAHDTRAIAERDYQLLVCAEWVDSVAVRSNIECHIAFDCCACTSLHMAVYSFSCNKRHGKQYNSDAAQEKSWRFKFRRCHVRVSSHSIPTSYTLMSIS